MTTHWGDLSILHAWHKRWMTSLLAQCPSLQPAYYFISRTLYYAVLYNCSGVVYTYLQPHYLSFVGWALFLFLPLFCLSSPPPQLSAHTALKVRHLPESHTATQSQQLGQTHTVHCSRETRVIRSMLRKQGTLGQITPSPCRQRRTGTHLVHLAHWTLEIHLAFG